MSHWPDAVERVASVLRTAGVEAHIEELPQGTSTARDAAAAVGCRLEQIVKSLVVVADGAYVLVLVPGDRRLDERVVAELLGAREVRLARADEVVHATGFEPGGVAPFPQRAVTQVLMDSSLLVHDVVWAGAGTDVQVVALPPLDLQRLARARAVDLAPGR
jgi:Cys-tRNA(Pro) deacylase